MKLLGLTLIALPFFAYPAIVLLWLVGAIRIGKEGA